MKQIDSQAIDWVDFKHNMKDRKALPEGVMTVHFRGRKWVYHYKDVPARLYNEFCALSEGHGNFFSVNIREKFEVSKEDA